MIKSKKKVKLIGKGNRCTINWLPVINFEEKPAINVSMQRDYQGIYQMLN